MAHTSGLVLAPPDTLVAAAAEHTLAAVAVASDNPVTVGRAVYNLVAVGSGRILAVRAAETGWVEPQGEGSVPDPD